MDFSKYKNTLPWTIDETSRDDLNQLRRFMKARKPDGVSHAEYGQILDETQAQIDNYKTICNSIQNAYEIEERRLFKLFKQDCFEAYGIENAPTAITDKIFEFAWDSGHSGGYESVYNAMSDHVELYDLIIKSHGL